MIMSRQQMLFVYVATLLVAVALISGAPGIVRAQDYDDEGYGNNQGGDNENGGYGANDDSYGGNYQPGYQQNVDSEASNNQPSNYQNQAGSSGDADGDYEGDDNSAAAVAPAESSLSPTLMRVRRSVSEASSPSAPEVGASEPKLRVKRHGKYYIGPVYTYVKTDKHANFKWGVKHKVGKKHYG